MPKKHKTNSSVARKHYVIKIDDQSNKDNFFTNICLAKDPQNLSQSCPTRMRAKGLTKLELALPQVFLELDESKKAAKPTLDLS
jgi:hypothetical protein